MLGYIIIKTGTKYIEYQIRGVSARVGERCDFYSGPFNRKLEQDYILKDLQERILSAHKDVEANRELSKKEGRKNFEALYGEIFKSEELYQKKLPREEVSQQLLGAFLGEELNVMIEKIGIAMPPRAKTMSIIPVLRPDIPIMQVKVK